MTHTITVGTKVEGNWGAMHPTWEGVVIQLGYTDATIKWGDADYEEVSLERIHKRGWTSKNGSPIGIFIAEDQ